MKTIRPLLLLLAGLLGNCAALGSLTLTGPATYNASGTAQNLNDHQISARTNIVGSITNAALVLKSTVTNFTIDNSSLLALVENSFNTNYPPGARLELRGSEGYYGLVVTDPSGTTNYQILDPVITPNSWAVVNVGTQTQSTTNHGSFFGNDTEAFTSALGLFYDDNLRTNTTDGTHTVFTMNCLVHAKQSHNLGTGATTENVTLDFTGGGYIRGSNPGTLTGSIHATISGNQ